MDSVNERDFRRLADSLKAERCVLVLGPDAVTVPGDAVSLSARLSHHLIEQFKPSGVVDPGNLYHVAQRIIGGGGKRFKLVEAVEQFYGKYAQLSTPLHQNLAALPFRLYLTVTHDHCLHNALSQAEIKKKTQTAHYHYRRGSKSDLADPSVVKPILYQLYGSLHDESSLILTENELLDFLLRIVAGTPPLPAQVEGLLRSEQNAFLFIGFGFSQWYVRILLHALLGAERQYHRYNLPPSLVLEHDAFFKHPDSRCAIGYFEDHHSFLFRTLLLDEFTAELVKLCRQPDQPSAPFVSEPLQASPVVFLSYRRHDIEKVTRLRERLNKAGIRTWQDVQNLRGGDRWEQAIKKVIWKQANYFVVVQTRSLKEAQESVVFDELREALHRDKRRNVDDPTSFIIPVLFEPAAGLDSLGDIHMIDLTVEAGIVELIQTIKDDWKKKV